MEQADNPKSNNSDRSSPKMKCKTKTKGKLWADHLTHEQTQSDNDTKEYTA